MDGVRPFDWERLPGEGIDAYLERLRLVKDATRENDPPWMRAHAAEFAAQMERNGTPLSAADLDILRLATTSGNRPWLDFLIRELPRWANQSAWRKQPKDGPESPGGPNQGGG